MAENQPKGGRVKINVGGTMFETSLSTLKKFKNSMLSSLVADHWKGQDELFIDRNPTYFANVLDYLRDGKYVVLPDDDNSLKCLRREAEFYNLPSLVKMCSAKMQKGARYSFHGQRARFDDGASNLQTPHSTAFRIGDKVQWADFAIETCWLSDYSRDHVGYMCTACGSYAFGTIVVTPEMMNDKEFGEPFTATDGNPWIPLNCGFSVDWNGDILYPANRTDQGYVVEVNRTCCRVKWDERGDSHVPQSAIRLARLKNHNYSPLSIN